MIFPAFGRSARRWAGAWLALLLCAWLAPSAARAGCHLGDGTSPGLAHFDLLTSTGAIATDDLPPPPSDHRSPCPGGVCSRVPDVPLPSPSTPSPTGHGPQWACLLERLGIPEPSPSLRPRDDEDFLPDADGPSIFHPPRYA